MRVPDKIYRRLPRRITRLIDAYQIWDEQLGGWLSQAVVIAVSAGSAVWTWLGESWLPMAAFVGIAIYIVMSKAMVGSAQSDDPAGAPVDEDAQHDLNLFASDHVLPLCQAHLELQEKIIQLYVSSHFVSSLAREGIMHSEAMYVFGKSYCHLGSAISQSPSETIPLWDLADHVLRMEKGYKIFFSLLSSLKVETGIDYRSDERVAPQWTHVKERHNELVDAYWHIKRDRRFRPTLYRPGISSLWTEKL